MKPHAMAREEVRTSAFRVGSSQWRLRSNSRALEAAFGRAFPAAVVRDRMPGDFEIAIDVHDASSSPPGAPAYFRGRDHLVFCRFGGHDCAAIDLLARRIVGRFSRRFVNDIELWQRIVLPAFLGVACPAIGVTPIHAACLQHARGGLLITAASGTGKSTLAVALAQAGLGFISDDWTYISTRADQQLEAWSPPVAAKLLPDTAALFSELNGMEPIVGTNGEPAFEVDPERIFAARRVRSVLPRWIVLFERTRQPGFELATISPQASRAQLECTLEELPPCLAAYREQQLRMLDCLVEAQCWRLRAGGAPQEIARRLVEFCETEQARPTTHALTIPPRPAWPDLLRRRVATPYRRDVQLGDAAVCIELESEFLLRTVCSTLAPAERPSEWRLVLLQSSGGGGARGDLERRFDGNLGFLSFGECGSVLVDARTRFAFGEVDRAVLNSAPDLADFFAQTAQILAQGGKDTVFESATCGVHHPLLAARLGS